MTESYSPKTAMLKELDINSKRVLVIDDIIYVQRSIARALEDAGYTVFTASNGKEALEKCALYSPALITLDMNLPDISGLELLKKLSETIVNNNTKTIFISAVHDKSLIKTVFTRGADYYMIKPFKKNKLIENVRKLLEERGR